MSLKYEPASEPQELLDLVEMMSSKELRVRTMLEEVFPSDMLPPPKA